MTALSMIFKVLGAASTVYMFLCVARLLMSWFPTNLLGRSTELVESATEPYLAVFRRIPFFTSGGVDFSPIAALAVLSAVSQVFSVASHGALTVGLALALVVEVIWSPIGFLLGFFAVLTIARIVAYAARLNSLHPVWRAIDAMINPVLFRIKRFFYKDRIVNYMQGLITGALVLVGSRVVLGIGFGFVIKALSAL